MAEIELDAWSWESLHSRGHVLTMRAKVPGGWLVRVVDNLGIALTFFPDPNHSWKIVPVTEAEIPNYGKMLRLTEARSGVPNKLDIYVNIDHLVYIQPATAGNEGAPQGAQSKINTRLDQKYVTQSPESIWKIIIGKR